MDALDRISRATLLRAGALAAVLVVAAACSSSTKTSSTTTSSAAAAAGGSGTSAVRVVVTAGNGALGSYLTDGTGRSLYEFASDSAGRSTCTGSCLTYWPALTSSAAPAAGSGLTAAELVTFSRSDGTKQVSYAGHPLYYFAQDQAPGDTNGQGVSAFGAKWWLLAPSGSPITAAASSGPASSAPASSGSSGSGYGGGGYGHG